MKRAFVFVILAACSKAPPADPVKLPKVGLVVSVPGATIKDSIAGTGNEVVADSLGALMVDADKDTPTEELVRTRLQATKSENIAIENLADGFAVTYEIAGSKLRFYNLEAHRKIGDAWFACRSTSTPSSYAARRAAALAACKSLAKS
ncbi:MAG TPA: hypothetical protein VGM90_28545 [Kofleriaceae bacterium]|jgi:hypothetical protein